MSVNKQVLLKSRPVGMADDSTWEIKEQAIPDPDEGEFLVKIEYVSLDPAMRGWISAAKSYIPPVEIGEVMRAGTIGRVIKTKNSEYKEGDVVVANQGVQQYVLSNGQNTYKTNTFGLPLPKFLGVLGMPGFTAYFGLLEIGKPKEGETVVVSGAAGAVGSVVGQIAKIKGCHVVGIAGGAEKCKYVVDELGFDACIDYKNDPVKLALKNTCPDGIDIYFDNVGGEILDTVLTRINRNARIPLCGAISQYNNVTPVQGPSNYLSLLVNRARMEGFLVFDYIEQYKAAGMQLGQWMMEGKLKSKEYIVNGIEQFPEAFNRLFSGDKMGKLVLAVSE